MLTAGTARTQLSFPAAWARRPNSAALAGEAVRLCSENRDRRQPDRSAARQVTRGSARTHGCRSSNADRKNYIRGRDRSLSRSAVLVIVEVEYKRL